MENLKSYISKPDFLKLPYFMQKAKKYPGAIFLQKATITKKSRYT